MDAKRIGVCLLGLAALLPGLVQAKEQKCDLTEQATAPTSQFEIKGNGTVYDRASNLTWKLCVEGQSGAECEAGDAKRYYYNDAVTQLEGSYFAGYGDWRLPQREELATIVEKRCRYPAFNLQVFPNAPSSQMWTGTMADEYGDKVWVMYTVRGAIIKGRPSNMATVRLVRGEFRAQEAE